MTPAHPRSARSELPAGVRPERNPTGHPLNEATLQRNAWLEIDLDALAHNLEVLRRSLSPGVEVLAVVKANAYGHGAPEVARELERLGVERLAVAWVGEGLALRGAGVEVPIVVLGHSFPADAAVAITSDLTLTCDTPELAEALSEAAVAAHRQARIHIKVDTGLRRFGLDLDAATTLAAFARELPALEVEGLSTHMANADEEDDSFSTEQADRFAGAMQKLPWVPFRHVANSATALRRPEMHFQGVRLGLSLYGLAPPHTPVGRLRPVMSLRARVARVTPLEDGEGVSYGLVWRAVGSRRVALVPVGYADGWRRTLTGRCSVLIGGRRAPAV
ncbi:MAG: alanine racemase, partial [Dehalococcoidia bacterium]